jgi:hypothetical protein
MDTEGQFAPETEAAARERYDALGSTAQTVVREVARAMAFDSDEYDERVTAEVVETAQEAIFSSRLEVHVADRTEYEAWCDATEWPVVEVGSETVDNVAWHAAPFAETVVAATFHDERDAAVATLRRQAFGRVYREVV